MKTLPGLALGLALALPLAARILPAPQETPAMEELLEQTRPGPEHARLAALAGDWGVALVPAGSEKPAQTGSARAQTVLGGRFLDVECTLGDAALRYTLGFDRRHGEYSLILIDDAGTYAVTARGPEIDDLIRMLGADDDPSMASLGFEKEFAFDLAFAGEDEFALALHHLDTRTEPSVLRAAYTHRFTRR